MNLTPLSFAFKTIKTLPKQWHENIHILYILSGSMTIELNEQRYQLKEDQLVLVNSFDIYSLSANQCKIALFEIHLNALPNTAQDYHTYYFDCNSATVDNSKSLAPIKKLLAKTIKNSLQEDSDLLIYSYTFQLLHYLTTHFKVSKVTATTSKGRQQLIRLEKIIQHLHTHYATPLTLKEIAEKFYISAPYLSKNFKVHLGRNFKDYINDIRLIHAIQDITNLDWSIEYIASKNGFASARSFSKSFQDKYDMLPSRYRKEMISGKQGIRPENQNTDPGFTYHHDLGILAKYLSNDDLATSSSESSDSTTTQMMEVMPVSVKQKGFKLTHNYKRLTTIGKAKQILYAKNQEMLRDLQEEIGFDYIKFHGLLDDDMMVYSENKHGQPILDFSYIDMAFDFLLSIHLKPLLELSFMPRTLCQTNPRSIFYLSSYISLPNSHANWAYLIDRLLRHLNKRYGKEEVETWPIYLWNQPDSPTTMFGFEDRNKFFQFYELTYRTIKEVNPKMIMGTPSLMTTTLKNGDWLKEFFAYAGKHKCLPSVLNYHFYPIGEENNLNTELILYPQIILEINEDAMKETIYHAKKLIKDNQWPIQDIYITEWNSTISQRDLLNDTAHKAVYIIKNILENYDAIGSFGYWTLSDFIEEIKVSDTLYHGGMGLFTYNGIRKSAFYAYTLLNMLGDTLIGRGEGYFITKDNARIQIILYNYQHYSDLYATGELFDMTFNNRYTPFPDATNKKVLVPLRDLSETDYILTDTILNRNHGSSFDKWVDLGALPLDTKKETDYLKSISIPKITKQEVQVKNGYLNISRTLTPLEVRFIEVRPSN